MKTKLLLFITSLVLTALVSCEKDAGLLPKINFKTGGSYLSADATLAGGSDFKIGITASKSEDKDVLKKLNVSAAANGGAASTIFSKDLSGSEGDVLDYDFTGKVESNAGQKTKYTFTVTNRDGLVNQVFLTITTQ
ncbi:MAG: hypothetical protein ABI844_05980 [Saprospiraceae bacterium]